MGVGHYFLAGNRLFAIPVNRKRTKGQYLSLNADLIPAPVAIRQRTLPSCKEQETDYKLPKKRPLRETESVFHFGTSFGNGIATIS